MSDVGENELFRDFTDTTRGCLLRMVGRGSQMTMRQQHIYTSDPHRPLRMVVRRSQMTMHQQHIYTSDPHRPFAWWVADRR